MPWSLIRLACERIDSVVPHEVFEPKAVCALSGGAAGWTGEFTERRGQLEGAFPILILFVKGKRGKSSAQRPSHFIFGRALVDRANGCRGSLEIGAERFAGAILHTQAITFSTQGLSPNGCGSVCISSDGMERGFGLRGTRRELVGGPEQ